MKAYLLMLTGAILLSCLLSVVVSEGKMGKFIKGITQLFVFSVVILPLSSLFRGENFTFSVSELQTDAGYFEACAALLEEQDRGEIERLLQESFGLREEIAEVLVERAAEAQFPRKKIILFFHACGIFEAGEHIDMVERIRTELQARFGCETEAIWAETA